MRPSSRSRKLPSRRPEAACNHHLFTRSGSRQLCCCGPRLGLGDHVVESLNDAFIECREDLLKVPAGHD